MNLLEKINEAKNYIESQIGVKPEVGMILGSGLGVLAEEIENPTKIPYDNIPHFLKSTVEGHAGQFVVGTLSGKVVMAMQGRFHYYEGYPLDEVVFPVRVMKALGIDKLIVTNAAGGANKDYEPGDLMIIEDHINFSFNNPLIGKNYEELGPRFPDTSTVYDKEIRANIKKAASDMGISLQEGVYCFFTGPTYETPAEVRMARKMGADAVGMSTVPEAITAAHQGMKVAGISCITNMAAGILDQPLHHGEVVETATMVREKFIKLVKVVVEIV